MLPINFLMCKFTEKEEVGNHKFVDNIRSRMLERKNA